MNKVNIKLLEAAQANDLDTVRKSIQEGAKVNEARNERGSTALMWAAIHNNFEMVDFLLEQGADLDMRNVGDATALHAATQSGHEEMGVYLINKGTNILHPEFLKEKIFIDIYKHNLIKVLEALFSHGYSANEIIESTKIVKCKIVTPLALAIIEESIEMTEYLIKFGANVNQSFKGREITPLMLASCIKNQKVLSVITTLLVEAGAEVNSSDKNGMTPLMYAVEFCHKEFVVYLLHNKANASLHTKEYKTALSFAKDKGDEEIIALIEEAENRNKLMLEAVKSGNLQQIKDGLKKGGHIDTEDAFNGSLLLSALKYKHFEIAKCLIENKANVNFRTAKDSFPSLTILTAAIQENNIEIVNMLIKYNADINLANHMDKTTPLMEAVVTKNIEIIKILLENKAKKHLKDKSKKTALDIARELKFDAAIEFLQ